MLPDLYRLRLATGAINADVLLRRGITFDCNQHRYISLIELIHCCEEALKYERKPSYPLE